MLRALSGTGREAAVKVFYPVSESLSFVSELLERGFLALAALRHPNIAAVLGFQAQTPGSKLSYLAMEYVRGLPLHDWSREVDARADVLLRRLDAGIQLADALRAAHQATYTDRLGFEVHGVLHGDLKPANVLLSDTGHVKLLDFLLVDIQRLLDPRVLPASYSPRGARRRDVTEAFGTPGFMSPEQEQHGLVTIKSDIFGLGVTLSYLFAPEGGDPLASVYFGYGIPTALKELIREMTAASPAARPDDMTTVLERLKSIGDTVRRRKGFIGHIWPFRSSMRS